MCGRFSITGDLDFYAEYFGVDEVSTQPLSPSWNVAPTDAVYVIAEHDDIRRLGAMKWGLVPHWAKDTKNIHINARAETIATNPAFRDSFARKRCLIPGDGFYEWGPSGTGRHPHWVFRADGHPMVFAGIWATRKDDATGQWLRSCSIVTTEAAGVVESIHDRMPLTLSRNAWDAWLDRDLIDPEAVAALMEPVEPELLMEYEVSKQVNSVRNNGPELRARFEPNTLF